MIAPPPLLYAAALVVGLWMQMRHPLAIAPRSGAILWIVGVALIAIGLMLSIAVMCAFRAAGTPVTPWRGTVRLVTAGPYRYSRNPDYIGQALVYAGIAVAADSWWPTLMLPLVLVVIRHGVVRREERYLEAIFGDGYRHYMTRVRRWL